MNIPFSESRNGLPVWRLQVEDPAKAVEAKVELASRSLDLPQGGVLALCLKLYDHPGRPALFHHAVAFGSVEQLTLSRHRSVLLVFERKGWMSDSSLPLAINFSELPAYGEGQAALAPYVEAYRRLQGHGPEAAWDAIEAELRPRVAVKAGMPFWFKALLGLLALALLGLGYFVWR